MCGVSRCLCLYEVHNIVKCYDKIFTIINIYYQTFNNYTRFGAKQKFKILSEFISFVFCVLLRDFPFTTFVFDI